MAHIIDESSNLNVVFVTSRNGTLVEEDIERFMFYLMTRDREKRPHIISNVKDFADYADASLDHMNFLDRLIPREIDGKPIPNTKPKSGHIAGIITDLYLKRDGLSYKVDLHGVGIVAWAVQHGIPVGIIAEDYKNHPIFPALNANPHYYQKSDDFFWLDSVIDTLRTDSRAKFDRIPIGNANNVCRDLREIILKSHGVTV
jgi:hypothetical protein